MLLARDLYWTCLAEDPTFASAWAWLGRCCWFLDKFSTQPGANLDLAQAAFQRAFAIDPDLAIAHQFYTFVEVDTGRAAEAMSRIFAASTAIPANPSPSPASSTSSVSADSSSNPSKPPPPRHPTRPRYPHQRRPHYFLAGDNPSAIETYSGRAAYYLDAAAWAALADRKRAIALFRDRLDTMPTRT